MSNKVNNSKGGNIFSRMWCGAKDKAVKLYNASVTKFCQLRGKPLSALIFALVILATCITVGVLVLIVYYITVNGISSMTLEMFEWQYTTENQSMMPFLINTIFMVVATLIFAVPIGVSAAIFLVEYSDSQSKLVKAVRIAAETLAGLPSIVYGLFGMLFFVIALGWGFSSLAGVCTMVLMILPLVTRTTEEALLAVPATFREGSYALGAGKLRTVTRTVLPSAVPGILSGVILGTGRIVGETAALIYTLGIATLLIPGLGVNTTAQLTGGRTLSLHIYACFIEGRYFDAAYATAFVLLVLTCLINLTSNIIASKLSKEKK